jgi:hypothetical protein
LSEKITKFLKLVEQRIAHRTVNDLLERISKVENQNLIWPSLAEIKKIGNKELLNFRLEKFEFWEY